MRRAYNLQTGRRATGVATVVAVAVVLGGAGFGQPIEGAPIDGGKLAPTHNSAITEPTAPKSTFNERRIQQRPDVFLLVVVFAGISWAIRSGGESLRDRSLSRLSLGRSLPVRDRGPPGIV